MENKSDSDDAAFPIGGDPDGSFDSTEFDNAVTSAITGVLVDPASIRLTDVSLANDSEMAMGETIVLPSADDEALEPGFVLRDRFEIVALIHSGGMGHVYKAIDNRRHRGGSDEIHVAIKMMRRSVAPQLDARLSLEREAAKSQRLSHPNIVNIYDFDQHDEQFYLVMEWMEGESVNALLRRTSGQRLAPDFSWRVIEGIVSGLQHAHSHNVVHADINPSNIFITDTQEIKLLDFGVARYASDPANTPGDGIIWATRTYASPEVLSGLAPTFEDDIFSLGCVAYRLLSGTHPFGGMSAVEAKQAGTTVQRIPGLSDAHWHTLSRALSYTRSDRPNTASEFLTEHPSGTRFDFLDGVFGGPLLKWRTVLPVVAIALLAGFWWLSQRGVEEQATAISEPASVDDTLSVDADMTPEPSELDVLLNDAAQAIEEQRFILPQDNNARDLYREVLARDSANSIAQDGLRTISGVYVQQANTALRADSPAQAIAALTIAEETDPANPTIAIVNELLLAQGNSQLANARLAAAEGDIDRATELLSNAERYAGVDVNAIDALRRQISQGADEQYFLGRLATADDHINAGRLLAPAGNNAQDVLLELQREHANDARLQVSMERLGERLLTRAAIATTGDQLPEASELLDAVTVLGVLATEVTAARTSLRRAMEETVRAESAPAQSAAAESPIETTAQLLRPGNETTNAAPADQAAGELISLPAATSNESTPAPAANTESEPTVSNAAPPARSLTLTDLDIQKYVAPRYPRGARRREVTGYVDIMFNVNTDGSTSNFETVRAEPGQIFIDSAQEAVSQWRFAPRDDVVTGRVTLRFEIER